MFMEVKARYVTGPSPTWTALGVSALGVGGCLAEVKVIAAAQSRIRAARRSLERVL